MIARPLGSTKSPRAKLNAHAWTWENNLTQEDHHKRNNLFFGNKNRDVMFHPSYSSGTAVVRGDHPFVDGHDYYWEIQVLSSLYGTDVMIGVGTDKVNLTDSNHSFVSLLGYDQESWGYSYCGTLQHRGQTQCYGLGFNKGSTVGMHLNMWNGTLSYFVDGKSLGVAFSSLKGRVLYPMVCSTAANSAMRLIYSYSCTSSLQQQCLSTISGRMNLMKHLTTIPGLRVLANKTLLAYHTTSKPEFPHFVKSKITINSDTNFVLVDSDEECFNEMRQLRRKKRKFNINVQRTSSESTDQSSSSSDVSERGCVQCGALIRPLAELKNDEIRLLPSAGISTRLGLCLFCDLIV